MICQQVTSSSARRKCQIVWVDPKSMPPVTWVVLIFRLANQVTDQY